MKNPLLLTILLIFSCNLMACPPNRFEPVEFNKGNIESSIKGGNFNIEVAGYENPSLSPSPCFGKISIIIHGFEITKKLYKFEIHSNHHRIESPKEIKNGAYRGLIIDENTMIFHFPLRAETTPKENSGIKFKIFEFTLDGKISASRELSFHSK